MLNICPIFDYSASCGINGRNRFTNSTQVKDESPRVKHEANRAPGTTRQWKTIKIDDDKAAVDLKDD
jgi:hypothetical protein